MCTGQVGTSELVELSPVPCPRKFPRLTGPVSLQYLTDLIWETPFFIYGAVVRVRFYR